MTNGTMTSWIITEPFLLGEYRCWNLTTILPRICPMIFDTDHEPSKRWKSWTMMETPTMTFLSSLPFLFAKGVLWFNDWWIVSSSKSLSFQSKTGLNQKDPKSDINLWLFFYVFFSHLWPVNKCVCKELSSELQEILNKGNLAITAQAKTMEDCKYVVDNLSQM